MLKIDVSLLVVFAIIWILLIVLKKVFFHPLRKLMDSRSDEVQDDLSAGQEAIATQERILKEIEEKLKAARAATREIQEKFVTDALKEKEKMMAEISRDCRAQVDDAKKMLTEQMEDLKRELGLESSLLSEKIEQRLLH
ncbi:MAG: ATP synthase F0 subunit B [Candidatus Aminicenantes bacterium]|nr:ATP synthase F0 subunit B [Candidatus Aminicenantes bacterium]